MTPNKPLDLREFGHPRDILIDYMNEAMHRWICGNPIPYIWGGQFWQGRKTYNGTGVHPFAIQGVDCSGFVILGLIEAGILNEGFDDTAAGLANRFPAVSATDALPGDLVFFGRSRVTHVGMLFQRDRKTWIMVEAGGGDKSCTSIPRAYAKNAFVCPAVITRRSDLRGLGKVSSERVDRTFPLQAD